MCGRYSITTPVEAMQRLFRFEERPNLAPRYNVAPTQDAPVVRRGEAGPQLAMLRWGLVPFWARDPGGAARLINARGETLAQKPAFRDAFRRRRCVVPADGYYEWQTLPKGKQPWRIVTADGSPMAFAGLWEKWRNPSAPDAPPLETFAIATTDASPDLAAIHDRMPVILDSAGWQAWLDPMTAPATLQDLLRPAATGSLRAYKVGARVGNVRNDDAELIKPLAETGQLF